MSTGDRGMSTGDRGLSTGDRVSTGDRMGTVPAPSACDICLRRPWLLCLLAGHLDRAGRRVKELLELDDTDLVAAVGGHLRPRLEHELERFDADAARDRAGKAGLDLICRCDPSYPERLWALPAPPTVLHVAGGIERFLDMTAGEPVAIVGTRRPSTYGLDVARALGRGLAAAGVTVSSGMAQGIDAAAHKGALSADGPTLAVLAGRADQAYPSSCRALHRRLVVAGAVVSELPPGASVRRWMFPARNRIIAALSAMTVVVEAGQHSGALVTAGWASRLGLSVGAVPGRVISAQAVGPHRLLSEGARLIRDTQDVLDALYGVGTTRVSADPRAPLSSDLRAWLDAIASGHDTPDALARMGLAPEQGLQILSRLELEGYIRRAPGGRFAVLP